MSSNQPKDTSSSFLYYEPAPYYEMDHLDDITFNQCNALEEELHLSRQLQTQLTFKTEGEKSSNSANSSSPTEVNMADLRAQVTTLVSQLERILSKVQHSTKNIG